MTTKLKQLVNDLVSQGRWDEAYSVLASHATEQAQDPDAQFELGSFCYSTGRYTEAERSLNLSSSGSNPGESFYLLGLTLLKLERPAEAMNAFRESCDIKPDFAMGHLHWGIALAEMNSWRGALGQFKQALKLNHQLAVAAFQAGVASYKLELFADSIKLFDEAISLDPQLTEALSGSAFAQLALGQVDKALRNLQKTGQLNNNSPLLKRSLANALMQLGKVEEATRQYQEVINAESTLLDARERSFIYNDWGVNLFSRGLVEEACDKLFQAVGVDPNCLEAHLNLGLVRLSLSEYEQAAEIFQKAIDLAPDLPKLKFYLGSALFLQGRHEEALKQLIAAQVPEVDDSQLLLWQGYCYMSLVRFVDAERSFRKALSSTPQNLLVLDALGVSLAFQNKHEEAMQKFKECLELNPDYALANLHLARSYEAAGLTQESMAEYKIAASKDASWLVSEMEAVDQLLDQLKYDLVQNKTFRILELMPDNEDAYLALARAFRGQQKYEEALTVLVDLLEKNPGNGAAYVLKGQVYVSQGQLLDADEMFRKASELFEGDVTLFYGWGKTLVLLGLHELALEKFAAANEIDPFDADVYETWGATLKSLGRYQEAAEVYKKASEYFS